MPVPDIQLWKYLAPALWNKMASPFPHSKYRKETSKQNSREDNHWSPSKPRSITLKRGGFSYQRNQHKPLSRQLMPGLVLSLTLFLSLLKTAMLQLNTRRAHAGRLGGAIKAWLQTLSLCLCFPFCCRYSSRHPLQFLFCWSPNPRTKCVCPTSWSSVANTETTTPHTTLEDDISSPLRPPHPHPSSPLIQSARPEFF